MSDGAGLASNFKDFVEFALLNRCNEYLVEGKRIVFVAHFERVFGWKFEGSYAVSELSV